ncbi:MAG: hypothetical protein JNK15_21730, partial [Planctomycetes bacterium]|nr:hypothetical protein [Planctomycetota bacterium]
MNPSRASSEEAGLALLAVLFALTLLMLLALPFAVSMGVGADAAARDAEATMVEQASASVREILLDDATLSHPSIDPTPMFDGRDEFPQALEVPKAFEGLRDEGRVLLGGSVVDAQRFLGLDGASPLLFANALGLTTRLREDLKPEDQVVQLEQAEALPDSGHVFVGGELIQYTEKDGSTLKGLTRGLLALEQGFANGQQAIRADALVLDYRCVLAAAWPFLGHDPARKTRRPYRAVGDLIAVADAGYGAFTSAELDTLRRLFTVDTMATSAATWGRPERVFNDLEAGKSRTLLVRSALHVGAGSTVRLRNLASGEVEYGLVAATSTTRGIPNLQLRVVFQLHLLLPVVAGFVGTDTVVEPLIPAPVNVNTADADVLTAICSHIRVAADVRVHDGQQQGTSPRWVRPNEALQLAQDVLALRGDGMPAGSQAPGQGPLTGWKDLVERVLQPRLDAASGVPQKQPWVYLYRNLQTGRDSALEMGTAPIVFQSGPWVNYRAAASRSRSIVAPGVVGRHERTGQAAALPGFLLQRAWKTQEMLEEAFTLDRRAPFWTTLPVNLGHPVPIDVGNDPAPRYFPHLVPVAYPEMGFG